MRLRCVHCHAEQLDTVSIYRLGIHPAMLELLADMGILDAEGDTIDIEQSLRIKKILQLRKSLGVNLKGAAIIVELLKRMEDMEYEIRRLREGR